MASPRALPQPLRSLAAAFGVLTSYSAHGGERRDARKESVVAVLEALGAEEPDKDPASALRARRAAEDARVIEPVAVTRARSDASLVATISTKDRWLEVDLELEDGERRSWTVPESRLSDAVDAAGRLPRGARRVVVELPEDLPAGYHVVGVHSARGDGRAHVLARPRSGARGRFDDRWRASGILAPLFTLHSARSWGCGDFGDLDRLASLAADEGVAVVSTLPLLAGPVLPVFEPSPYVPLSRSFWHERWIDMDEILGRGCSADTAERADGLRASIRAAADQRHPLVDGHSALAAKRAALELVALDQVAPGAPRAAALDAFLADRPGVVEFARFRAATERHGPDWSRWPARMRDGELRDEDVDSGVQRLHAFAQWVAHTQLSDLAERCERRGQVLSLDLPVGSHPRGFDAWSHPDQYVAGVSVGAPPDRFFPRGQIWGFPPPNNVAVRSDGHAGFRAAISHHLNVARMLRIDHLIGLQRLFWVPEGLDAEDGVYVESPLEELLAIVAIEAHRHRATIVGEDLGTVDAAVRHAMDRDGIRRSFVVELSVRAEGSEVLAPIPPGSVASFSTHDLPTFAGWWDERDIDERVALHQVDVSTADQMRVTRDLERRRLSLLSGGADPHPDAPLSVLSAAIRELAESEAGVVVTQLDDLLGERDAVNLPGTSVERANWQRRTCVALEDVASQPSAHEALAALRASRPSAIASDSERGGRHVETRFDVTRLGELDEHLFSEGRHARLYDVLGAHEMIVDGVGGTCFAVWAPNAAWVEVIGDFNDWDGRRHPLARRGTTGIWEGFVPGVGTGVRYKFRLASDLGGGPLDKADPFATAAEPAPLTASVTAGIDHEWHDTGWMAQRARRQSRDAPISIYEVHLGSWRRVPEEGDRLLTYAEIAPLLADYVVEHGFTHVELLPVMEHPFFGSWGYHVTGFFAPTSRYGTASDFAALVDTLHGAGIGVILDWVPAHFPSDAYALAGFDGTHLFEHADPRQGLHPDWQSLIFNYGRHEVRSFLLSAACFWLDAFHVDGLRFDAVASMLYLDYSRGPGEWIPNRLGGRENLDAIEFLTTCNDEVHRAFPGVSTFAEESTAWPGVTSPTEEGGLGFDYKWDLGWMHDTLDYLAKDPIHRRWHHDQLTFRSMYATSEQFVLPLSHDEVVHGKSSLLDKMPGDDWQRFANVRLLLGFQLAQPGKKLLFMGDEFAQRGEWRHDASLDWHQLNDPRHRGIAVLTSDLNSLYTSRAALHRDDRADRGFAWIDGNDREQSVLCIERFDGAGDHLVIVLNATPQPREGYLVGMPAGGRWHLLVNSDDPRYGGSGHRVLADVEALEEPWHGRAHRVELVLPPLALLIYGPTHGQDTGGAVPVH